LPLQAAGYDLNATGDGERMLPTAIIERPVIIRADGQLEPVTARSTLPVAQVVQHAGICRVARYETFAPPGSAT